MTKSPERHATTLPLLLDLVKGELLDQKLALVFFHSSPDVCPILVRQLESWQKLTRAPWPQGLPDFPIEVNKI